MVFTLLFTKTIIKYKEKKLIKMYISIKTYISFQSGIPEKIINKDGMFLTF